MRPVHVQYKIELKQLPSFQTSLLPSQDNVGIQHVMASYLPGHYFAPGRHHVLYQATDADGNKARCGFTITVRPSRNTVKYGGSSHYMATHKRPPPPPPPRPIMPDYNRTSSAATLPRKCQHVPKVENGRMTCVDAAIGRKCTPVCHRGHRFYQKFTSRPPTYVCNAHRVDWEIRR